MGLVDDNFTTAFINLNRLEVDSFSEFLELILVFLSSPKEAQQFISKLEKYAGSLNIPFSAIQLIAKAVLLFFRGCLQKSLSITQIAEDLSNLGLNEDKTRRLTQNWSHSFGIISNVNQQRVLTIHQLTDLEWRFGVTTGNSLASRVGKIFLQMKFKIFTGEIISIEMSIEQFYSFLHEMEKARASIEYLI
ncbi:COMM domain-containing protein 7 [Oopsacas minuta]|uniref:COMM domain-containing protein 7 n=1 Tax=Oopsacas minuta TaxID=111878 RepID=A0AAV7JYG6_9METZ|nr:COMM domain-containing protein 7 [Oopsacas minuta]